MATDIRVRVHGIDKMMRQLARTAEEEKIALRRGIHESAEHLKEKIEEKIGVYQSTGGSGGGPWAKLKFETNMKKLRRFGFSGRPLFATGKLKGSLYVHDSGGKTLMSSVGSDDPKMVHHVYGAPKRNLPPRDPMMVTANEEVDECRRIIIENIYQAYK